MMLENNPVVCFSTSSVSESELMMRKNSTLLAKGKNTHKPTENNTCESLFFGDRVFQSRATPVKLK